jgi:nucleoside recognition membrane protein YjiH
MNLITTLVIVICLGLVIVAYQSRSEPFNPRLYFDRLYYLGMIVITYFKQIGLDAAIKFKQIDWNLTTDNP